MHACYAEGRKERRWAPNLRLMPADEPSVEGDQSSVVDRDQLERGFRRLSLDHRAEVVLYHYLDMPLDGIAETLDIPVGTAHSRLHHAHRPIVTIGGLAATKVTFTLDAAFDAGTCDTTPSGDGIVRLWPDPGPDESGGWPISLDRVGS